MSDLRWDPDELLPSLERFRPFYERFHALNGTKLTAQEKQDIRTWLGMVNFTKFSLGKRYVVDYPGTDVYNDEFLHCAALSTTKEVCAADPRCEVWESTSNFRLGTALERLTKIQKHKRKQAVGPLSILRQKRLTSSSSKEAKGSKIMTCEAKSAVQSFAKGAIVEPSPGSGRFFKVEGFFTSSAHCVTCLMLSDVGKSLDGKSSMYVVFRYFGEEAVGARILKTAWQLICNSELTDPKTIYQKQPWFHPEIPTRGSDDARMHSGWATMLASLIAIPSFVDQFLDTLFDAEAGRWKYDYLTVTGFCMGGALSHLFTYLFKSAIEPTILAKHPALKPIQTVVRAFAAPRTGNKAYAGWFVKQPDIDIKNFIIYAETHKAGSPDVNAAGFIDPLCCWPQNDMGYYTTSPVYFMSGAKYYVDGDASIANMVNLKRPCRDYLDKIIFDFKEQISGTENPGFLNSFIGASLDFINKLSLKIAPEKADWELVRFYDMHSPKVYEFVATTASEYVFPDDYITDEDAQFIEGINKRQRTEPSHARNVKRKLDQ